MQMKAHGFVVPRLPIICPVAANPNPYGMPVEISWREISELLQLWHGRGAPMHFARGCWIPGLSNLAILLIRNQEP